MDLNIDEDTLMKLAPFYRTSLAPSTGPSRLIYYERFEIHPIKVSLTVESWCLTFSSSVLEIMFIDILSSVITVHKFRKLFDVHVRWLL